MFVKAIDLNGLKAISMHGMPQPGMRSGAWDLWTGTPPRSWWPMGYFTPIPWTAASTLWMPGGGTNWSDEIGYHFWWLPIAVSGGVFYVGYRGADSGIYAFAAPGGVKGDRSSGGR